MSNTVEEQKDQTRLAIIPGVFTPEECSRIVADYTPLLKPALIQDLDAEQSVGIRKSSAVFVFPNEATGWVFQRLNEAIHEINDALYAFDGSEFREGFQFTRYEVGEYYGPHFDIGPGASGRCSPAVATLW